MAKNLPFFTNPPEAIIQVAKIKKNHKMLGDVILNYPGINWMELLKMFNLQLKFSSTIYLVIAKRNSSTGWQISIEMSAFKICKR